MKCLKCGNRIKKGASFCVKCGDKIELRTLKKSYDRRRKLVVAGVGTVVLLLYIFGVRCKAGGCPLLSKLHGEYCSEHTCVIDDCTNKKVNGERFCYTHLPSTIPKRTYTSESPTTVLRFSNIDVAHNSLYTVCTGTITNNGHSTYTFVEVKGKFEDNLGRVLDTDWTYAVGTEGLAPGESTTFRMSVDKDIQITDCSVQVIDYDRD